MSVERIFDRLAFPDSQPSTLNSQLDLPAPYRNRFCASIGSRFLSLPFEATRRQSVSGYVLSAIRIPAYTSSMSMPRRDVLGLFLVGFVQIVSLATTWAAVDPAMVGNAEAAGDLGDLYKDGEGVPKNAALAAEWYRKGADGGDGNAMNLLGACYWQGLGLENSPREAINWWKRGAEKGNASAKTNLQMALKKFDESGRPRNP